MQVRSLLRTGWGPRGDSGSARGRVRATQPASFSFCFPLHFKPERMRGGPATSQALLFFCNHRHRACILENRVQRYLRGPLSNEWVKRSRAGAI